MPMNAIVREKRKNLGLTQEQIADYLGVSTPAVNKWEKGTTYPDISLLPALARLLKTDLNTLLCYNEGLSKKEIGLFLEKVVKVIREESFEQGVALAMEKVQEYPNSAELLYMTAMTIQGSMIMSEMTAEQKKPYEEQITTLYERVAKCDDPKFSIQANYMLASKWIQNEAYDKAQETIDLLPESSDLDKRQLQAELWMKEGKNAEAAKILERILQHNLQMNQIILHSLAKIAIREGDDQNALHIADCAQKEARLFELWGYSDSIVPLEVAVLQKDVDKSISLLKSMLAAVLDPWDMKKIPFFKHIVQDAEARKAETRKTEDKDAGIENADEKNADVKKLSAMILPPMLLELENNPDYDFLRPVLEFQQLLKEYRSKCESKDADFGSKAK